jgi:hypothetical protein
MKCEDKMVAEALKALARWMVDNETDAVRIEATTEAGRTVMFDVEYVGYRDEEYS